MCKSVGYIPRRGIAGSDVTYILSFALLSFLVTVWVPVYLTVPYQWTFRCFQFVFPVYGATRNIFMQLSLCVGALGLQGIPRNLRTVKQEVLR